MLTQLGQVSVQLFDNIIVGKLLGTKALAAVSLGNAIFFSIFVFAMGFSFAIPPLVSEAHSKLRHNRIISVLNHGLIINLTLGVLLTGVLWAFLPLLPYMDQPEAVIPDTESFLFIMTFSLVPFMFFQTFRELSEGLSFTAEVTKATIAGNILNIILNYVLIKGMFGLPAMGVQGSAAATLISRIFMAVMLFLILKRHKTIRKYVEGISFRVADYSKAMFTKMLKLGFPTSLQMLFEVSAFAGAAFICGLVSENDIAAHQIALSMASFTFNICIGFSVASTVMVGNKLGERDFAGLRGVGINNIKLSVIFMGLCGLGFIIFRDILPSFFAKPYEVEVMHLASQLLIIAAIFQLSDGIQVTALGCLRGIQDVKTPSFITFIAYWVITLPLGYILCVQMKYGAVGMWYAFAIGLSFSASFLVIRFLKLSKSKIDI